MFRPTLSRRLRGSFERFGDLAHTRVEQYLPNAFVFSLILTLVSIGAAVLATSHGPLETVQHWGDGFWFVLEFSMQASLALITGWAFADSPPVRRLLKRIAALPSTQNQALLLTAVVGQFFGLLHWGVVLIVAAIFAREIAVSMHQRDVAVHYPLLVATAYAGLLPWHQGLSGAAMLLSATEGHFLQGTIGVIPVSQTTFSAANLVIVAGVVLVTVAVMPLMAPRDEADVVTVSDMDVLRAASGGAAEPAGPARDRRPRATVALLESRVLCAGTGLAILGYLAWFLRTESFLQVFDFNLVIMGMLGLGFLSHGTLDSYVTVIRDAAAGASQIMVQFQFYGGIMGVIVWSGLAESLAAAGASVATETTWYLTVFLTAGLTNFFVPSGGGQWIVLGEIFTTATQGIPGASTDKLLIAYAMGDQWSNMIQPFWALPMLGIAGLGIRDIMGYTTVLFVCSGLVMGLGALLMGVGVL